MSSRTRIKCSGCHKRTSRSEPDAVLSRDGSTKLQYYHQSQACIDAAKRFIATNSPPAVWWLTMRHIDPDAN